jgi:hypothetical protein
MSRDKKNILVFPSGVSGIWQEGNATNYPAAWPPGADSGAKWSASRVTPTFRNRNTTFVTTYGHIGRRSIQSRLRHSAASFSPLLPRAASLRLRARYAAPAPSAHPPLSPRSWTSAPACFPPISGRLHSRWVDHRKISWLLLTSGCSRSSYSLIGRFVRLILVNWYGTGSAWPLQRSFR